MTIALTVGLLAVAMWGLVTLVKLMSARAGAPAPAGGGTGGVPPAIRSLLREVLADGRITDEELEQLTSAARDEPSFAFDEKAKVLIAKARLLYKYETGELPTVQADCSLERGEVCHAAVEVKRFKSVTATVETSGGRMQVQRFDGEYSASRILRERFDEGELVEMDSGKLYLTNRRVFFEGAQDSLSIKHSQVTDFRLHNNGVLFHHGESTQQFFGYSITDFEMTEALVRGALRAR